MPMSRISYKVAIPSYFRPTTLRDQTLRILQEHNIPPNKIHIFVADKKQKKEYKKIIPKSAYHKMIIGKPGIKNIRNFMAEYFAENEPIFFYG